MARKKAYVGKRTMYIPRLGYFIFLDSKRKYDIPLNPKLWGTFIKHTYRRGK